MLPENEYLKRVQKEREKRVFFEETVTSELVKQYTKHQPFLLSTLEDDEELRSRVAFVDVWRKEFEALHKKLKELYGTEKGEFSYLKDLNFLSAEVYEHLGWFGLSKNQSYLPDMMKDYLTYLRVNGGVTAEEYNEIFKGQRDQSFRTQEIVNDQTKWDFLIDRIPKTDTSDQQKEGLRECRKWMYRNCPKGGALNNTGHKRGYIDAFGKTSWHVQLDTLFLLENGKYKEYAEEDPLPDNFIPELNTSKKKMVYSRWKYINPYHLWRKFSGDSLRWERMEAALNKARSREKARKLREMIYASVNPGSSLQPLGSAEMPMVENEPGKLKQTQFIPQNSDEAAFEEGSDIALLIKSGILIPVDACSAGYSFLKGAKTIALGIVDTVSGAVAILGSAFSTIYGGVRARQSANSAEAATQLKEKSKQSNYYLFDEQGRLYNMAKISETRNDWKLRIYARISGYSGAWLLVGIPAFCGVCSTIFGVVGGVISAIGGGLGLWLCREANKKTAEKAVILAMKAEDKDYKEKKADRKRGSGQPHEKGRYIKRKIEKHRNMLGKKLKRLNPAWAKIVRGYIESDDKIKDRILEHWAVKHGCSTIYSVLNRKDTGNAITALRYVLLKNPNGNIAENNLIKKEDAPKYFSEEHCSEVNQKIEMARTRMAFKALLETERIDASPATDCNDVLKRMNIRWKKPEYPQTILRK